MTTLAQRIARLSCPDGDCAVWTGYVNPHNGYGQISIPESDRRRMVCARTRTVPWVVCFLEHGPPPSGAQVLHSCDNRLCVKPEHLRWGTQAENNREAWARGRQRAGALHHQAKFTDAEIAELRARVAAGERPMTVFRDMAIDTSYGYRILREPLRRAG